MEHVHLDLAKARELGIVPALLLEMQDLLRGRRFEQSILWSLRDFNRRADPDRVVHYAWQWCTREPNKRRNAMNLIGPVKERIVDEAFADVSGLRTRNTQISFDPGFERFLRIASTDDRAPLVHRNITVEEAESELNCMMTRLDLAQVQLARGGGIEGPQKILQGIAILKTKIAILRVIIASGK